MWIEWFICAVLHTYPAFTQSSGVQKRSTEDLIPCAKGWFYFRDKCYKLGGKRTTGRLNQEQAAQECKNEGGHLVTIQSEELQEFLVTFLLLDAKAKIWIGLNDRVTESTYVWEDGSIVNYTNWGTNEPSGLKHEHEDCVEMVFNHRREGYITGQWNDISCSQLNAYICEAKTSKKSSPDPRFCSDIQRGWKSLDSCYHLVPEKKSWEEAEKHCQSNFNGHLVTIKYFAVEFFLEHILSNFNSEVWIGIKIQEKPLQQWTSGWYVSYSEWDKNEGVHFSLGTCSLRSNLKLWKRKPCSKKYSFICETYSVDPPIVKQPVNGAACPELPEVWWDLGGEYCYFFHINNNLNGYQANFDCIRRGGSLASIHSEEESILLHQFIIYSQHEMYIGFIRRMINEDVFVWTDGSPVDYVNFDKNEPDRDFEMCVGLRDTNMKWFDDVCQVRRGYICSVKKVLPNVTEISTRCDCPNGVSTEVLIGASVCILLVVILTGIMVCCFQRGRRATKKKSSCIPLQPGVQTFHRSSQKSVNVNFKEDDDCYENMD